ncbi:unnamed protein product [Vitrella brassicaformis CCMP3155]|uniref:HPt domain-containing protein n=1 Tax=Vitrella brassicaformis (strain CCMP3155) TaxID=1169540 RepID=A0A0G4EKA0_VITBC|nr:unnamed protein product [Vitrella brassicaformis CCMP3155]|mmetsp:Transcript_22286/g.54900  ORF Transcript_22286/g.54900 Transcript_22286/m.54900 type:complete len:114 (-) Transcript_22286:335-676(-)|eukprot:CEL96846.1 unnamed protein product [Vitrella brassicaformis CCMP3155]
MSYKHFDIGKGAEIIGDEETFLMLLGRYKEELQTKVASILSAWDKKDYQTMRKDAHALKGSSGYAAADHLQRTCEAIQLAVDKNQLDSLPQLIDDFRTVSTEAKDELDRITAG